MGVIYTLKETKLSENEQGRYDEIKAKFYDYLKNEKKIPESKIENHERGKFPFETLTTEGYEPRTDFIVRENNSTEYYMLNVGLKKTSFKDVFEQFKPKDGKTRKLFTVDFMQEKLVIKPLETVVSSFQDFIENIKDLNDPKFLYCYRGQQDGSLPVKPSIYRHLKNDDSQPLYVKKENVLFNEAVRQIPEEFPNAMSTFEKLTKMQHYGLPTRLVDVSLSPLIALYFAVKDTKNKGATVFVYSIPQNEIHYIDEDVNSLADIANTKDKNLGNDLNKVLFVKPNLNNERIKRQMGCFFLYGIGNDGNGNPDRTEFAKNPYYEQKFVISGGKIESEIKEILKILCIDSASVLPEIDKKMEQIKGDFDIL